MIDSVDAYGLLDDEVRTRRAMPYPALLALIGAPAQSRVVQCHGVEYTVESEVRWKDRTRDVAEIVVSVMTPNTWKFERMQKRVVVEPPSTSTNAMISFTAT